MGLQIIIDLIGLYKKKEIRELISKKDYDGLLNRDDVKQFLAKPKVQSIIATKGINPPYTAQDLAKLDIFKRGEKNSSDVTKSPKRFVYPFFAIHMLMFGAAGFMLSYEAKELIFAYIHGGIAIFTYIKLYTKIFGVDEVKWMFINALIGILEIKFYLFTIASLYDINAASLPIWYHIIPGMYIVIYIFLLRNIIIDIIGARNNANKMNFANIVFVIISLIPVLYAII